MFSGPVSGEAEERAAPAAVSDRARLEHAGAAFHAIFDSAPHGMLLVEASGRIFAANPRVSEMFGFEPGELVGESIEALLPHRYRAGHRTLRDGYAAAPVGRAMGQGRDLTGLRKDGVEFPLEIGLNSIETSGGRMTCAAIIDITERKRGEIRLREANMQLQEFTYVASHDLRSPIRGIANLIEFIREDCGDDVPLAVLRNLDRMDERIGKVEKLINDLLAYARAGRSIGKLETISLPRIVAEIIELENPPAGLVVTTDLAEDTFDGARTPLTTVIRNLLSNAIKHHDRKDGHIAIRAHFEGSECIIEVEDDGPGIPQPAQERVFRLFQTLTASQRSGAGIGLAVVQRLVDRHGGAISIFSRDGERGTRFRVSWPRYVRTDLDD
ncbi:sensor histidine kinase [Novosphingobium album (ex Liu et al. 2023)]|uniref:histidine kinase n=1 Tax=Novosphingobium album (ex Liu et al. 2023) TaxID=3031130 RepID=A0ABT5WVU1_9SPHN|nr:PAS domain-containing sensor histidine kinase [Novosphingobium album (ex Liu et al. 2023)]MDE8654031.1 PAS domain-containing sensor histidine kinase [Novosphingobium album (ex Liu et al. 2023)]